MAWSLYKVRTNVLLLVPAQNPNIRGKVNLYRTFSKRKYIFSRCIFNPRMCWCLHINNKMNVYPFQEIYKSWSKIHVKYLFTKLQEQNGTIIGKWRTSETYCWWILQILKSFPWIIISLIFIYSDILLLYMMLYIDL